MSKFNGVKTDNKKTHFKIKIRQDVLDVMGDDSSVLDVFCGSGEMYSSVWCKAKSYLGIDKRKFFDERNTICGDARKVIKITDLSSFTVFDIDSYGAPYQVLRDVLEQVKKTKHKRIAFILTDGSNMDLKMGRISKGLRFFLGVDCKILKNAHIMHDDFIRQVVKTVAQMLNGEVVHSMYTKSNIQSSMRYYSFIINRDVV